MKIVKLVNTLSSQPTDYNLLSVNGMIHILLRKELTSMWPIIPSAHSMLSASNLVQDWWPCQLMELKSLKNVRRFSTDARNAQMSVYHARNALMLDGTDIEVVLITDAVNATKFRTDQAWSFAKSATSSSAIAADRAITNSWAAALNATLIGSVTISIDHYLPLQHSLFNSTFSTPLYHNLSQYTFSI